MKKILIGLFLTSLTILSACSFFPKQENTEKENFIETSGIVLQETINEVTEENTIENSGTQLSGTENAENEKENEELNEIQKDLSAKETILNYYDKLSNHNFEEASNLTNSGQKTAEELAELYQNLKIAIPYNIEKIAENTYQFDVYFLEEGDKKSTSYEVRKKIVDNKLESISSKTKETINPIEFSIKDPNNQYDIFFVGEKNIYEYFNIQSRGIEFLAKESLDLQKPELTESEQKLLNEKIAYFQNFFNKYSDTDTMKEYRIRDNSYITAKEDGLEGEGNVFTQYRGDLSDDGISIFIIENKDNYTANSEQILTDFRATSGIPQYEPIRAGNQYFALENFKYCGASICPFQISELRDLINSENFVLK